MSKFTNNITYATVDLLLLQTKKPQLTGKVLSEVTDLIFNGRMDNIAAVKAFPISQIEAAFRLMQIGRSMGKIIVEPQDGDQVKVCRNAQFNAQFITESCPIDMNSDQH